MNYDYKIYKCRFNGWTAETQIELGKTETGLKRVLEFTTLKRYSGVSTRANVWEVDEATGSRTTMVFGDYGATVKKVGVKRATEKAITQAHLISASEFDTHIEAAKAQYAV